ncbi:peptidoglycan-binding domain-containing protein [Pararhodobacter marinus]|nr:peptidoglycan-binding domain-containing protein [Pararhodobacter marinus]
MLRLASTLVIVSALLSACQTAAPDATASRAEPAPVSEAPMLGNSSGCWSTDRIPAVTQVEFVSVEGAEGLQPRERVLQPAEDRLFAVPCPEQIDDDTVATLQRALAARGHYAGPITGEWDQATSEAVRRFQAPLGLDSGILTLQAAQMMGLVVIPRESF